MNVMSLTLQLYSAYSLKKEISYVMLTLLMIVSLPFLAVGSMGSSVLTFLSNMPSAEAAETQGFYMGGEIPGNTYAWGNCTYWAYAMRLWAGNPIPVTWGNANTWDDRAEADGYEVNRTPRVGAVYQSDAGDFGHVAYVKAVDPTTGSWTISEMNAPNLNVVSTRTFNKDAAVHFKFIHSKKGAQPWTPQPVTLPMPITGK